VRRFADLTLLLLGLAERQAHAGKAVSGVVSLNTAPAEVLSLLPGVGPAKAAAILTYRRHRPFPTVDELVRIKGIGRKMVRGLRPHLAIAGRTTAIAAPPPGGRHTAQHTIEAATGVASPLSPLPTGAAPARPDRMIASARSTIRASVPRAVSRPP
jgi:competence protein ComEA